MNGKSFIHKSAFVEKGAKIGEGTKVWHNVHVMSSARIGKNCILGQNSFVAGKIGDNCKIQNNVNVYEGVELGNYVFCGPSMTFTNVLDPRSKYPQPGAWVTTKIEEGVSFGAGVVVVCGIRVGKHALVGAGTVVTKDVPDYALVYGNPGRVKGWVCECGEKLGEDFSEVKCTRCEKIYEKNKNEVRRKK